MLPLSSPLDAIIQTPNDGDVQVVLENRVLDPRFDARIVVDLHHEQPPVNLLDIDAIETITDQARCPNGEVDDFNGNIFDSDSFRPSVETANTLPGFLNLPVTASHVVSAHIEGSAVQHANPPVEVGRNERLRDDELGFLQELMQISRQARPRSWP